MLWHSWFGVRKSNRPVKIEWWGAGVAICLELSANDVHMVQLMPATPQYLASFGLTFLMPAYPGCPAKVAVKRVSAYCIVHLGTRATPLMRDRCQSWLTRCRFYIRIRWRWPSPEICSATFRTKPSCEWPSEAASRCRSRPVSRCLWSRAECWHLPSTCAYHFLMLSNVGVLSRA